MHPPVENPICEENIIAFLCQTYLVKELVPCSLVPYLGFSC